MEFCLSQKGHLHDMHHLMACFSIIDMCDFMAKTKLMLVMKVMVQQQGNIS